MPTVVILGAGATHGSSIARTDRPPPLLRDLGQNLFLPPFSEYHTSPGGNDIRSLVEDLLDRTGLRSDIEAFLSSLHICERIRQVIEPGSIWMSPTQIDGLLRGDQFDALLIELGAHDQMPTLVKMLRCFAERNLPASICPRNLVFSLIPSAIRTLIDYCLASEYHFCERHASLFRMLTGGDAVVSYNYDDIADVTLWANGRLSQESFAHLGFTHISLPPIHCNRSRIIPLLKMHGSFNWLEEFPWLPPRLNPQGMYYTLRVPGEEGAGPSGALVPVVLPFYQKELEYLRHHIYLRHLARMGEFLMNSDKVVLVGKTFMNSDESLNEFISQAAKKGTRSLWIIDPATVDGRFISFHEELFNGKCTNTWKTLEEFHANMSAASG
jgi:hypothetical protein